MKTKLYFLFFASIMLTTFSMGQILYPRTSIISNINNGLWSDTATWWKHTLPTLNDDIILSQNITVDSNSNCKSLNLHGYNVTINTGNSLTISGNLLNQTYHNEVIYSDTTSSSTLKIVAIIKNVDLGFDFYFWGKWDNGIISKISSATVNRHESYDTSMHFVFDDSLRVKNYFISIKGKNDSNVYKFRYQNYDTGYIYTKWFTNWTDSVFLRQTAFIHEDLDTTYVHNGFLQRPLQCISAGNLPQLAFKNVLASVVGWTAIGVGLFSASALAPVLVLGGAVLVLTTQNQTIAAIGTVVNDFFISNACASEMDSYSSFFVKNPDSEIFKISSLNNWSWCPCAANLTYPVWPLTYSTTFSNYLVVSNTHDIYGPIAIPQCAGGGVASLIVTRYFLLKSNSTVNFTLGIRAYNFACGTNSDYSKTFTFICN